MADTGQAISTLEAATSAADVDVLAGVQTGATKKFSFSVLLNYIKSKLLPADIGAVPNTRTVNSKALSADIALTAADVGAATTADIPEAYATNPEMDGTASAGSSPAWARGDHVHPSDTSKADVDDTATAPWYGGIDLTQKFATEIAAAPYSGDEWAWIKARITAGDYSGIRINDYIPVTANGNSYKARIMGINTYTGYGDTAVGNHIDWIFEELWPTKHPVNPVAYNNGTKFGDAEATEYPWLASDLYLFVNSLSGTVASDTTAGGGTGTAVNYTADGIYYYLPQKLKNVIIQKRAFLTKRYSESGKINNPNSCGWENAGYIWLPTECEVYGCGVWGNTSYEKNGFAVQYPYFVGNMNRVKKRSGDRNGWWLLSAYSGSASYWCAVSNYGHAVYYSTANTGTTVPVCFRIA